MDFLSGSIAIPKLVVVLGLVTMSLGLLWTYSLVRDRNPLPFPDRDYHVFSTSSLSGLIALEALLQQFGHAGFRAELIPNAEPGLPISFVTTDALKNAALVFRKHVPKMGQKSPRWTPRVAKH